MSWELVLNKEVCGYFFFSFPFSTFSTFLCHNSMERKNSGKTAGIPHFPQWGNKKTRKRATLVLALNKKSKSGYFLVLYIIREKLIGSPKPKYLINPLSSNIPITLVFKLSRDICHAKDLEVYYWQNLDFLPFWDQGGAVLFLMQCPTWLKL